jgi:hypothetical protein
MKYSKNKTCSMNGKIGSLCKVSVGKWERAEHLKGFECGTDFKQIKIKM